MALFKIFKGSSNNLGKTENGTNVAHEGFAYFTPDDGKFYIDIADANTAVINTNRIPLSADKADKIKQTITNSDVNYKILLSNSSTPISGDCDSVRYGANLIYNPVNNVLETGNINLTGALDVIGNVDLHNQTSIDNLTAGTVLVTGGTNFTQIPTAPTAAAGDSSTKLATTEFVTNAVVDTKVTQSASTTASWRKVLLHHTADAASTTDITTDTNVVYAAVGVSVQPSTGTLAAGVLQAGNITVGGTKDTTDGKTIVSNSTLYLKSAASTSILFQPNGTTYARFDTSGYFKPETTGGSQLGTSANKWAKLYVGTADSYGSTSQPIYWNNGVPTAITGAIANNTTGSAATLTTTRKIDGINFNGSADVLHYGACSTAVGTAAKTVAITGFTLTTGAVIYVKFTNGNTANDPTLNVNNTGAKNIYFQNGTRLQTASSYPDYLQANKIYQFMYDGTNYVLINNPNVLELYEKRTSTTSLNKTAIYGGAGAMFHIIANSSTTTGKTPTDANIFQMNWDNNGGYDSQLGISTSNSRLYVRSRVSEGTAWREAATIVAATKTGNTDTPVYVNETGQVVAITGALANSITGNAATATKATQDSSGNNIIDTYLTKVAGVTAVTWDNTNKKITKTINGTTTDVVEIKAGNGISLTAAAGEVTIDGYTVEVVRLI